MDDQMEGPPETEEGRPSQGNASRVEDLPQPGNGQDEYSDDEDDPLEALNGNGSHADDGPRDRQPQEEDEDEPSALQIKEEEEEEEAKPQDQLPSSLFLEAEEGGNAPAYECQICRKKIQNKSSVTRHITTVHKMTVVFTDDEGNELLEPVAKSTPAALPCPFPGCGKTFSGTYKLERHQSVHEKQRKKRRLEQLPEVEPLTSQKKRLLQQTPKHDLLLDEGHNGNDLQEEEDGDNGNEGDRPHDEEDEIEEQEGEEDELNGNGSLATNSKAGRGRIPYRCVVGNCVSLVDTKSKLTAHIKSVHGLEMVLLKEGEAGRKPSKRTLPYPFAADSKLSCGFPGCISTFTNSSHRIRHIRSKHPNFLQTSISQVPVNGTGTKSTTPRMKPQMKSTGRVTRSYACDFPGCDKVYSKSSHVKRHQQVHAKQSGHAKMIRPAPVPKLAPTKKSVPMKAKAFKCNEIGCNQGFTQRTELSRHIARTHRKSKPVQPKGDLKDGPSLRDGEWNLRLRGK